jgi:hypothetical protein
VVVRVVSVVVSVVRLIVLVSVRLLGVLLISVPAVRVCVLVFVTLVRLVVPVSVVVVSETVLL